jgi:hypothetical protein
VPRRLRCEPFRNGSGKARKTFGTAMLKIRDGCGQPRLVVTAAGTALSRVRTAQGVLRGRTPLGTPGPTGWPGRGGTAGFRRRAGAARHNEAVPVGRDQGARRNGRGGTRPRHQGRQVRDSLRRTMSRGISFRSSARRSPCQGRGAARDPRGGIACRTRCRGAGWPRHRTAADRRLYSCIGS